MSSDLPEAIHTPEAHPEQIQDPEEQSQVNYNYSCQDCGSLCCYGDDTTYSKSNKDPGILKNEIDSDYRILDDYMAKNKLVLNSDKTHLLVLASSKNH